MRAILTLTPQGAIALPASLREALGFKAETPLVAETTAEGLLLKSADTFSTETYTAARIQEFDKAEQELAQALQK